MLSGNSRIQKVMKDNQDNTQAEQGNAMRSGVT